MSDVDEIIDYIRSLKKGFDKDLFQSKIDDLARAVDTGGLEYEDFLTLFKLWLNLSILPTDPFSRQWEPRGLWDAEIWGLKGNKAITKWVSIGVCLVPLNSVSEQTVDYTLCWLLANIQNQNNFTRIAFLLDWLTAAMDCESIDIAALDCGYEIFFSFLTYDMLSAHVSKLVYTLTKPTDVTRKRVLELFDYARIREGKKSMCRQLQVLLGLFKSYKPEVVPEDIPAVPVHTTFKSNITLLTRFKRWQDCRNNSMTKSNHLKWTNPMIGKKSKIRDSIVPNIEFLNFGSQQYADKEPLKNHLDFNDPVSLLQYSVHRAVHRPARLRALLRNQTGLVLLALSDASTQAALHHDIRCMLTGSYLDASPHSAAEKSDALKRVAALQRALCQPLQAVTAFLAHFLQLWNEAIYFSEVLELMEWVDVDRPEVLPRILEPIAQVYHRAQPMEQCAILRTLAAMYSNLVYTSTRRRQYFLPTTASHDIYPDVLRYVASTVHAMCGKQLQVDPEDMRVLYSSIQCAERLGAAELRGRASLGALPAPAALALPLLTVSADLLDKVAGLILLYKKILRMNASRDSRVDQSYVEHKQTLKAYTADVFRCLAEENAFSGRQGGFVFKRLHPQVTQALTEYIPEADSALSLRHHLAFASHAPMHVKSMSSLANKELCFDRVINKQFTHLSTLLTKLGYGSK